MTDDTTSFDIEVIDKIAPTIDTKLAKIAESAREAYSAINKLNEMLELAGRNSSVIDMVTKLTRSEIQLATAQARLSKELEQVNLTHIKSEILLRKEAAALDLVAEKAAKLAAVKPIANLAANLNSQFGINDTPKSAISSYSSLSSVDNKISSEKFNSAQNGFNQFLGINTSVAKSARDSASAFTEAAKSEALAAKELEGYQSQAQALKDRLDPLSVATRMHADAIATADMLLRRNLITTKEHAQATEIAGKQLARSETAIRAMGGGAGLATHQLTNLSYQLNDVFVSLYSGQKPLTVFIQQGSQIAQIFGETGVRGALKGIGSYLMNFLTVGRVAFAGVASAAAIGAIAFNSYLGSQKSLETAAKGIGSYALLTGDALETISNKAAIAGKVSISSARDMTTAFLNAGNANKDTLLQAVSLTKDLSATLGISIEDGKKQLESLFSDPIKGAEDLNRKLNFLDANTIKYVKSLVEQGDKQKAVALVLDSVKGKLEDQGETVTALGRFWDNLSRMVSDSSTIIGKRIDSLTKSTPKSNFMSMFGESLKELNNVVSDVTFNKITNETAALAARFDDFDSKILSSKNSIIALDKTIEAVTIRMRQTNDAAQLKGFEEQLVGLNKAKDAYIGLSSSLEKYGNTQARLIATNSIDLAMINATTTEQRAGLAAQKERISLAGTEISLAEQDIRARQVAAVIIATAKKQRDDEIYALKEENKLIGMLGPQRQLETELMQREIAAKASGNTLSKEYVATLREQLIIKQAGAIQDAATNSIYEETIGALQSLGTQVNAINTMYEKGAINSENYAIRLNKVGLAAADLRLKFGNGDYVDATNAALGRLTTNYEGVLPGLSNSFGNFFQGVNDGFADSIGKAIVMSDDLEASLKNVAQQAIASLIGALIKLGIQYAVNTVLGQSLAAAQMTATTTASVAQAGILAAAWAPAAAAVSLATSGSNSLAADAGMIQTNILARSLALPAFADGGRVMGPGTGTSDSILAKVSNGEFIVNAKASNDNLPLLKALNSGAKISGFAPQLNKSISGDKINVTVINNGSSKIEVEQLSPTEIRIIAQEESRRAVNEQAPKVIANSLSNPNSSVSKAVSSNTTASRRR